MGPVRFGTEIGLFFGRKSLGGDIRKGKTGLQLALAKEYREKRQGKATLPFGAFDRIPSPDAAVGAEPSIFRRKG